FFKPGDILTSMIKRVDVAVNRSVVALALGTWTAGFRSLGLLENGVELSNMTYTQAEKNALYTTNMTRWDKIQELALNISNGEIVVPDTLVGLDINFDFPNILLAPEGLGTTISDTSIIFAWNPVSISPMAHLPISYQIEIDSSTVFTSPILTDSSNSETYVLKVDELTIGSYYFRVRAIESNGKFGEWTDPISFEIIDRLISTDDNQTSTSDSIILPGFTIITTIVAICLGIVYRKKNRYGID
ncbi:MAG: hypothetical protein ACXAC2_06980, partial [Candidatus Kariarchaeaceae archaeon]